MRLHALQYLRALAAYAVVYAHTTTQHEPYSEFLPYFGSFGVDIFFVISGFIMVWIARETDAPLPFFINRIRRVVPLYWFFTLLMAAILLVAPQVFKNSYFEFAPLLKSLFFLPYWSSIHPGEVWPLVAPGWSLNYEMYFYLLFALSLIVKLKWRVPAISIAITLVFVLALRVSGPSAAVSFLSESIVFEFILGMWLALSFKRGMRLPSSGGVCLIVAGVCWLLLDPPMAHLFRYGVPSLLIVAGCLYLKTPENRFGVLLGDSSYALYLSHIFTLGLLAKLLPPILGDSASAAWVFVLICFVVCVIGGIVVHVVVDNWLLRTERLQFLKIRRADPSSDAASASGTTR
jgi:exopolysaccharide production protein ExoZ